MHERRASCAVVVVSDPSRIVEQREEANDYRIDWTCAREVEFDRCDMPPVISP